MFSNKAAAAAIFSSDLDFDREGPQKTSWNENEVFAYMKSVSKERKFEESIELTVKLNVDPTQGD